ncbi:bifunctional [glutamate--ammonia ligase]-adenylyl-L-tyrosine phosphorylase/[glutamate--ammonia-ligase] adenylyltransferase [Parachitinimonas caeni]|uniref:Bifunctional glutamine synthetase adenylyltransferase/adenylyl-removing enzyme n=1 Tax=Parachitinimonas caeni TaxID=3031301 RepID=A0ABT7E5A8_9NEIS|nr:bifunctional [glutamate--ammonia ligase]-adenylyl-L-tyrosine phosphorylase/[glutamate--ammonia-ligase] adenylyltransferase [Parachitinimonas caeni]MDK2126102.1 bifunctional [glutamate--ammonia ligase]-adenylyl-L-tyrosine phosphorylase/[glutamate--ammonia-ligase] adenylyltransferase [Parachitinimonas caeni]
MSHSLAPALAHSRYLQRLFAQNPTLADTTLSQMSRPFLRAEMDEWLSQRPSQDEAGLKVSLRLLRQAVMARLIGRELAGLSDLYEVMATTSDLAEAAIAACLKLLDQPHERYGQPIGADSGTTQRLIVVGMGKLGGRELNVSSDIDLIFVYPEDGETDGPRPVSNHEYFSRIGKQLIALLHDPTLDGFVFRVDMRLRPYGDSGPLVSSFAALENYFYTQGREWERYAWIKGRPLSGDQEGLMQIVRPFIYRKYLDYGAYGSMRDLHAQIQREVIRRDLADNIKLGPGGIREVEFIAQVFQLIRGGRNRALQVRPTQPVLAELAEQGLIGQEMRQELNAAYVFLRNLEHRLQYLDDAQTQTLPGNDEDRQRIAHSMGCSSWQDCLGALDQHRSRVSRYFEQVFMLPQADGESVHPLTGLWLDIQTTDHATHRLKQLGYAESAEMQRQLAAIASSHRYQTLGDKSRRKIDALIPPLIEVAASFSNPDATLTRILRFLETISRREAYLALLTEHPQTLRRLASLYSASPWVSDYLNTHPILLDELLDARILYSAPDWPKLAANLRSELEAHAGDAEAQMDLLRHFQHTQIFRLVAQDLAEHYTVEALSDQLSALADLMLTLSIERCWAELPSKHREHPNFAIIGYGKLGGKELGYGSDLDLIFIYDDTAPEAAEQYARLAKRINNWLTTATPAGQLYDIDLRLRPNGASGLLVSSIEAFSHYQQKEAWVWEHQALTRARYAAGDVNVGERFETIRREVLMQKRDPEQLAAEVLSMRNRMLATHPPHPTDIKHVRGGIVDVEFIVQYLVLAHAEAAPDLTRNSGNIALLGTAVDHGLIPAKLGLEGQTAYREFRRIQHTQRLDGTSVVLTTQPVIAGLLHSVQELWLHVFGQDALHG